MPKEQLQQTFRRVKEMMEQKSALNVGNSMSEYINPGPVENNIYFGLELKKLKTKERKMYALNLAEKYGLKDFLKKHPSELSGGMRQRVAFIRTLALKPEILLLDEPFSALDYQTRLELCDNLFEIIKKEEKTAILVTHDIMEAISMSDKVIVLTKRPGRIKEIYEIQKQNKKEG